jgi:hypothetical protein
MTDAWTVSGDEQDTAKVVQYLRLVQTRILRALSTEAVQQSCSTTLLLGFAIVDALGKLTHPNAKAGAGSRFKYFLAFLGPRYKLRVKEIWELRNALVHNAINVESYLSSVDIEGWTHLQTVGGTGLIYLNTAQVSTDLRNAFERVKALFAGDNDATRSAAARLKWVDNMPRGIGDQPIPTPPSQIQFIFAS